MKKNLLKTGLILGVLSFSVANFASAQTSSTQQLVAYLEAIPGVVASQNLTPDQAQQLNTVLISLSADPTLTPEQAAQYASAIQSILPSNTLPADTSASAITEDAYAQNLWFVPSTSYSSDLKSALSSVQGVIEESMPNKG